MSTETLVRRGNQLEWATFWWNAGELVIALACAIAAHSLALMAFGLETAVEIFGSLVVLWHLRDNRDESRARRSNRLMAYAFAALAVYLGYASATGFAAQEAPGTSLIGTLFMAITALVMYGLAFAKHRVAARLHSAPLHSNAHLTVLDGYLATGILMALAADALFGIWWLDPLAAAVIAALSAFEAWANWTGKRD